MTLSRESRKSCRNVYFERGNPVAIAEEKRRLSPVGFQRRSKRPRCSSVDLLLSFWWLPFQSGLWYNSHRPLGKGGAEARDHQVTCPRTFCFPEAERHRPAAVVYHEIQKPAVERFHLNQDWGLSPVGSAILAVILTHSIIYRREKRRLSPVGFFDKGKDEPRGANRQSPEGQTCRGEGVMGFIMG